jgi:hypothetical protein
VKFAFIDTNILLHYPQPDKLDWCGMLGADSVTLVVAPVVIRELNDKKDTPGPRKTRDRAASALRWLEQFIGQSSPQVQRNVDILLQSHDPQIDFSKSRLSQAIHDDWLIAALLEFRQDNQGRNALLVTDDIGLTIKAQAHGITVQRLPQDLKLPEEVEPAEKRVRELEDELRRVRNAMADLCLVFDKDKRYLNVQLPRAPEFNPELVCEKMAALRCRCPKLVKPSGYSGADLSRGVVLGPEEIDHYNKRLDNYYRSFEEYLEKMHRFEILKWGTVELKIVLLNQGGAPAKDIDVFIHFPDGFEVYDQEGCSKAIVMPREPERPMTRLETMVGGIAALRTAIELGTTIGLSSAIEKSMRTRWSNVGDWSIKHKDTLTCGDDKPEKGGMLLKSGTKEKQHIVAIQPNGQGSLYQLIALGNWSSGNKK